MYSFVTQQNKRLINLGWVLYETSTIFYTNTITENTFDIADKELAHQWKHVFRYNVGSQVVLFDGSGADFLCMISSLRNGGATVEVFWQKKPTADVSLRKKYLAVRGASEKRQL